MKSLLVALTAGVVLLTACTTGDDTASTPPDSAPEVPPETTTTQATLPPDETERAVVEGVLDGDSLRVSLSGSAEEVRLLGINAPERDECFAEEARSALTALVAGVEVAMLPGDEDRDRNGRLLRYVYIEDPAGPILVNETLLRDGSLLLVLLITLPF